MSDLLREYSRYVRPVLNETKVLEVYYHMKLSRILKIVSQRVTVANFISIVSTCTAFSHCTINFNVLFQIGLLELA